MDDLLVVTADRMFCPRPGLYVNCPECGAMFTGDTGKQLVDTLGAHLYEDHSDDWPITRVAFGLRVRVAGGG